MSDTEKKEKKARKAPPLLNRRDFLKIAGATGAALVFTEVITSGPLSADAIQGIGARLHAGEGDTDNEWRMAIDLGRCIGCNYCVWACQAVNDVPDDNMRWNVGFPERTDNGQDFYMTRPCLHCTEAPCVRVCPVGATWVRHDGIEDME